MENTPIEKIKVKRTPKEVLREELYRIGEHILIFNDMLTELKNIEDADEKVEFAEDYLNGMIFVEWFIKKFLDTLESKGKHPLTQEQVAYLNGFLIDHVVFSLERDIRLDQHELLPEDDAVMAHSLQKEVIEQLFIDYQI